MKIAISELIFDATDLDPDALDRIRISFAATRTQIAEILVRPERNKYRVVAGRHRCAVAKELKWPTLRAKVLPYETQRDKLNAEMIEIDENLARRKITPALEAILVTRRKAIFEALHPEAKAGAAQAAGMNRTLGRGGQLGHDVDAFSESQADLTGKSGRTIRRAAQRGAAIGAVSLKKVQGTSLDTGEELDALAKLPAEPRAALIERARQGLNVSARLELKRVNRNSRQELLGLEQQALPDKKYGIILCDYPREYRVRSRETGLDRAPDNHYPVMTFEQIVALPVQKIAAKDSILFMWSTAASLLDDIEIMAEWGFVTLRARDREGKLSRDANGNLVPLREGGTYRSHQIWHKLEMGLGHWFRDMHELVMVGVRGDRINAPAKGDQDNSLLDDSIYDERKTEHSAKPDRLAEMIDRLWPTLPKIELFRRGPARPGWDGWGKEFVTAPAIAASLATEPPRTSNVIAPIFTRDARRERVPRSNFT